MWPTQPHSHRPVIFPCLVGKEALHAAALRSSDKSNKNNNLPTIDTSSPAAVQAESVRLLQDALDAVSKINDLSPNDNSENKFRGPSSAVPR